MLPSVMFKKIYDKVQKQLHPAKRPKPSASTLTPPPKPRTNAHSARHSQSQPSPSSQTVTDAHSTEATTQKPQPSGENGEASSSNTKSGAQPTHTHVRKDDFVVLKMIGEGSFAKVFLVQKLDNGKHYAMKVVEKAKMLDQGRVRYLFSERNVLKRAHHPFIMKLHFTFQSEHQLFFVMDHFERGDLLQHILSSKNQQLPELQAKFFAAEVVLALEYLHSNGVIYRDLKPSNILMDTHGHVCLADMGLCKMMDKKANASSQNRSNSFVGSPAYVAPEILLGRDYGVAVDWWSFGVLMFRMLCGKLPFDGKDPRQIYERILHKNHSFGVFPWVSSEAKDLIERLLDKDERRRLKGKHVKKHPFFNGISWRELHEKTHLPPGPMPALNSLTTPTSNFRVTTRKGSDSASPKGLGLASPCDSIAPTEQELFEEFTFVADSRGNSTIFEDVQEASFRRSGSYLEGPVTAGSSRPVSRTNSGRSILNTLRDDVSRETPKPANLITGSSQPQPTESEEDVFIF